jgi:hypothetical protein
VGTTSLEMREVFADDCGTYTAVAKNLGGESRTSCRVALVDTMTIDAAARASGARRPAKPQFVQPLEDCDVLEGNRTRLECIISGYPEPEVLLLTVTCDWYVTSTSIEGFSGITVKCLPLVSRVPGSILGLGISEIYFSSLYTV